MNLFQHGSFTLASGLKSDFKIDCDALTKEDWETCAYLLNKRLPEFSEVRGVPRGGLKLAEALEMYAIKESTNKLIVDDVWTTGISLSKHCKETDYRPDFAAVVFARNALPYWCVSLFNLSCGTESKSFYENLP